MIFVEQNSMACDIVSLNKSPTVNGMSGRHVGVPIHISIGFQNESEMDCVRECESALSVEHKCVSTAIVLFVVLFELSFCCWFFVFLICSCVRCPFFTRFSIPIHWTNENEKYFII